MVRFFYMTIRLNYAFLVLIIIGGPGYDKVKLE